MTKQNWISTSGYYFCSGHEHCSATNCNGCPAEFGPKLTKSADGRTFVHSDNAHGITEVTSEEKVGGIEMTLTTYAHSTETKKSLPGMGNCPCCDGQKAQNHCSQRSYVI